MIERVVVTGASSGIGAACVSAFQTLGADVIGVDVSETSQADQHLRIDLADADCGVTLLQGLEGVGVEGLVNSAGVGLDKSADETTADDFDRVVAVNLRAPLLLASSLHSSLESRNGFVINVASVHALATSRMVAAYAASKGGLVAMTRALALEWAPTVRVNAVLPGAVETGLLTDGLFRTGSTLDDLARRHPLGRVGQPADIADAVVFLAQNRFMTGSSVVVDGGATARLSTE